MKFIRKETAPLQEKITLLMEPADYEPKVNAELQKLRSKGDFKGFRKGKAPLRFVKKMYGTSVLLDVINKKVQEEIFKYIDDEKLNILGSPLPSEEQEQYNFDPNQSREYEFKFDVGLVPEFEIKGVSEEDSYPWKDVQVPEEELNAEVEMMRRRAGEAVEVEDPIEEDDILYIEAVELEDGKPKDKGHETDFRVLLSSLTEENKEKLKGRKKGFEFDFNIYQLEKDRKEAYVKKYLLQMDEDEELETGEVFHGKVTKVERVEPAELNEEFFGQMFGDEVSNEEEMRDLVRKRIKSFYDQQADELFYNTLYRELQEKNDFPLPEVFLKRLIRETSEEKGAIDNFDELLKSYRWSILRSKLNEKLDIQVHRDEIKAKFIDQFRSYLQGQQIDEAMLDGFAERMLENKEQVQQTAEKVSLDKLFHKLKETVGLDKQEVSVEEFKALVKEENRRLKEQEEE